MAYTHSYLGQEEQVQAYSAKTQQLTSHEMDQEYEEESMPVSSAQAAEHVGD